MPNDSLCREITRQIFQDALGTEDFAALARATATPGGATAAGIRVLEEEGLQAVLNDCLAAAAGAAEEK